MEKVDLSSFFVTLLLFFILLGSMFLMFCIKNDIHKIKSEIGSLDRQIINVQKKVSTSEMEDAILTNSSKVEDLVNQHLGYTFIRSDQIVISDKDSLYY